MKALIATSVVLCLGSMGFYGFVCVRKPNLGSHCSQNFFMNESDAFPQAGRHTFSESRGLELPSHLAKSQAGSDPEVTISSRAGANVYNQNRLSLQSVDSQSTWAGPAARPAIEPTQLADLERAQRPLAEQLLVAPGNRPEAAPGSALPRDSVVFAVSRPVAGRDGAFASSQSANLAARAMVAVNTGAQVPDVPAEQLSRQRDTTARDTAPEGGGAPAPSDAEEPLYRSEVLFTTKEQHYRSLYGSAVFYAAKLEEAKQAAGTQ
jgi:hypothetical protein